MTQEPSVIFESRDFAVIDKPSGLMVHGVKIAEKKNIDDAKRAEPTLVDWLLVRYPEVRKVGDDPEVRPGIVHRLDKATSGVMIIPRTQEAFLRFKHFFHEHRIEKVYRAIVFGIPLKKEGVIDMPIGIKSGTLKRSIHSSKMAKPAFTQYRVVRSFSVKTDTQESKECALLEVRPKTGRTHQIRVHLASIGHPIVGDMLYGTKGSKAISAGRLMLHAQSLQFSDDEGNRFEFEAPMPDAFASFIHSSSGES